MEYDKMFFSERLAMLRIKKDVSARDMSLSIGQSANYINKIESKKSYPSMAVFFQICEYLEISPKDFFDINSSNPTKLNEALTDMHSLTSEQLENITSIIRELKRLNLAKNILHVNVNEKK